MRAAVISDTHDAVFSTQDALDLIRAAGVDTIIHCGDMSGTRTAELFHEFCVYHAWGNNDIDRVGLELTIRECRPGSRSERWIKGYFDGKLFGAVHDMFSPEFRTMIESELFDYIFVGHTHRKLDEMMGRTRVINPGAIGGAHRGERGFCLLDFETSEKTDYVTE